MKKYKDYTAEEKAEYKAKRDAYWAKREAEQKTALEKLEAELKKLKASPDVIKLLDAFKKKEGASGGGGGMSNLMMLFGTDTPEPGTVLTFKEIGIRGPNGERLNKGETIAQFVTRVGDIEYKFDARSISEKCWYINRAGHNVVCDKIKATVTFVS